MKILLILISILLITTILISVEVIRILKNKRIISEQNVLVNNIQMQSSDVFDITKFVDQRTKYVVDLFFYDHPRYLSKENIFRESESDDFYELMTRLTTLEYQKYITKSDREIMLRYIPSDRLEKTISNGIIRHVSRVIKNHVAKINNGGVINYEK